MVPYVRRTPEEEKEPPIPSYEDEYSLDVIRRDKWDYRILRRRHFDEAMQRPTEECHPQCRHDEKSGQSVNVVIPYAT